MAKVAESSTVQITAKEALAFGMKEVLDSGQVHAITPHHGRAITIKKIIEFDRQELVAENKRGKRRKMGIPSIAHLTVEADLAAKIQQAS